MNPAHSRHSWETLNEERGEEDFSLSARQFRRKDALTSLLSGPSRVFARRLVDNEPRRAV